MGLTPPVGLGRSLTISWFWVLGKSPHCSASLKTSARPDLHCSDMLAKCLGCHPSMTEVLVLKLLLAFLISKADREVGLAHTCCCCSVQTLTWLGALLPSAFQSLAHFLAWSSNKSVSKLDSCTSSKGGLLCATPLAMPCAIAALPASAFLMKACQSLSAPPAP